MSAVPLLIKDHSVCASAPGKVILFGEHAVVYGHPALAASLSDLRIFVLITPTPGQRNIHIQMPDLPIPIDFEMESDRILTLNDKLSIPPTAECSEAIRQVLGDGLGPTSVSALTPLIYLIQQLAVDVIQSSGLDIHVRSRDLPVGAGLGSSAAFSVASAAALLHLQQRHQAGNAAAPPLTQAQKPDQELLRRINQYAYHSEILLHGTPSGIDNAVSTFGGAILFSKNLPSVTTTNATPSSSTLPNSSSNTTASSVSMDFYSTDQLPALASMPLLIVDTHVPRSTKQLVAGVRTFYNQHPTVVSCLLQAMGLIAKDAAEWLVKSGEPSVDECDSHYLLKMVETNQYLLQAVGVSHASLDRICKIVKRVVPKQAAAKLTGAGGGGCAIVLFDSHADVSLRARVQRVIERASWPWRCTCFSSSVGGDGVLLLPPSDFPVPPQRNRFLDRLRVDKLILTAAAVCSVTILYSLTARSARR